MISDRNFILRSLAALTPHARWRYRCATHEALNDITEWSPRWSTPLGTTDAYVADGVRCPDGRYFGSIRAPSNLYDQTFSLFGTTSLAAGDAADRCLSASPNYSPAAVLRYNALHSLYFV